MAYVFPLRTVLQLRRRNEEAEERALSGLNEKLQTAQSALQHLQATMQGLNDQPAAEMQQRTLAAHLQATAARLFQLREQREQLRHYVQALQAEKTEQQERYLAARTAREVLTELDEKHEKAWRSQQADREKKELQEIIALRWKQR